MKSWLFGCVCASFFVFLCDVASAGAWATFGGLGSINTGRFASSTPTSGAINGNLSATDIRTNGSSLEHFDAFADFPTSTTLMAGKIDIIANASPNPNFGRYISVGSTQWGRFTGTIVDDDVPPGASLTTGPGATRTITIFGTFVVGSHPLYEGGPSGMIGSYLTIFFKRNATSLNPAPVLSSWSLSTYGAVPIPEPTSIVIFGAGLFAYALRRRPR
jgi:hypothetical protein